MEGAERSFDACARRCYLKPEADVQTAYLEHAQYRYYVPKLVGSDFVNATFGEIFDMTTETDWDENPTAMADATSIARNCFTAWGIDWARPASARQYRAAAKASTSNAKSSYKDARSIVGIFR